MNFSKEGGGEEETLKRSTPDKFYLEMLNYLKNDDKVSLYLIHGKGLQLRMGDEQNEASLIKFLNNLHDL